MRLESFIGRVATATGLTLSIAATCHAQALETETARFIRTRQFEASSAIELQSSTEGVERSVPLALEYGLTDRVSLLAEPVAYTTIRPRRGTPATGIGDLELTGFYLLKVESRSVPALALALELKLPTTHDPLIGTGQTDVSGYLIASRRFHGFDTHANTGYTFNGSPPGTRLNGTFNGALAVEVPFAKRFTAFGEVLGTTSAAPEGGGDNPAQAGVVAPEAAGGEFVGTFGCGMTPVPGMLLSLSVSYDNNHAILVRPAVTLRSR